MWVCMCLPACKYVLGWYRPCIYVCVCWKCWTLHFTNFEHTASAPSIYQSRSQRKLTLPRFERNDWHGHRWNKNENRNAATLGLANTLFTVLQVLLVPFTTPCQALLCTICICVPRISPANRHRLVHTSTDRYLYSSSINMLLPDYIPPRGT